MAKGVRGTIGDAVGITNVEDLLIESVRDLVKDEVKKYIRAKIEANPELKKEIKKAVEEFMEAKVKESVALVKIAKCGAKLGLEMIPPHMREEMMGSLVSMFENELSVVIGRSAADH